MMEKKEKSISLKKSPNEVTGEEAERVNVIKRFAKTIKKHVGLQKKASPAEQLMQMIFVINEESQITL